MKPAPTCAGCARTMTATCLDWHEAADAWLCGECWVASGLRVKDAGAPILPRGNAVRALTIRQPYASLIITGRKRFETRSWKPPEAVMGEWIAIHAASRVPPGGRETSPPQGQRARHAFVGFDPYGLGYYPLGAVIGTAKLVNAGQVAEEVASGALRCAWLRPRPNPYLYPDADNLEFERTVGDFGVGRWLWELAGAGAKPYPIPATGYQNFWNWESAS